AEESHGACPRKASRNMVPNRKAAWLSRLPPWGQAPPPGVRPRLAGSDPVRPGDSVRPPSAVSGCYQAYQGAQGRVGSWGEGCQEGSGCLLAFGGAGPGAGDSQLACEGAAASACVRACGFAQGLVAARLVEDVVD